MNRTGVVLLGALALNAVAFAAGHAQEVLVVNTQDASVSRVDLASLREVERFRVGARPYGIAFVDPAERALVKFHPLNVNPRSLTFSADESRLYFASYWVDGFFEMDPARGKVTRLIALAPPSDDAAPQEVTYHGVESVGGGVETAAADVDRIDVGAALVRRESWLPAQ